jgi:hypothetical protein
MGGQSIVVVGALAGALLAASVTRATADPQSTSETAQPEATVSSDAAVESLTVEARRERITQQVSRFVSSVVMPARHESLAQIRPNPQPRDGA